MSEFPGRCGHLFEGHRAVLFERREPRASGRRHHHAVDPGGHIAAPVADEMLDAGGARPSSQAADRLDGAVPGVVDHDRGHSPETGHLGLHHVERDAGGDARVDCVSTLLENAVPGDRGQVVACRDHVRRAHHRGAIGTRPSCDHLCCPPVRPAAGAEGARAACAVAVYPGGGPALVQFCSRGAAGRNVPPPTGYAGGSRTPWRCRTISP